MFTTAHETWVESPYPTYFFSSLGRAGRRLVNGSMRILVGCKCGRGYRAISVPIAGARYRRVYIHRGVCEAFHGAPPDGNECRHLNGDITDNRSDNLRWGTAIENARDKRLHGTDGRGERNAFAKLTRSAVSSMKEDRKRLGLSFKALGQKYGVSTMTAYRATIGQSWN